MARADPERADGAVQHDATSGIGERQPPPPETPRRGPSGGAKGHGPPAQIFFPQRFRYHPPMFRDLPIRARELKATPAVLERIYEGARLGLKGESLALAAGLLPEEFARLKLMDRTAEIAEMKGRADSEMSMSRVVFEAAENGDAKAALEFLRHRHEWVAKQQVQVDVSQQISITAALEQAQRRVEKIAAEDAVVIERAPLARPQALGAEV